MVIDSLDSLNQILQGKPSKERLNFQFKCLNCQELVSLTGLVNYFKFRVKTRGVKLFICKTCSLKNYNQSLSLEEKKSLTSKKLNWKRNLSEEGLKDLYERQSQSLKQHFQGNPELRFLISKERRAWYSNLSERDKETLNSKKSKSLLDYYSKEDSRIKTSQAVRKVWESLTEEEKESRLFNFRNYYFSLTSEEKLSLRKKSNKLKTYRAQDGELFDSL